MTTVLLTIKTLHVKKKLFTSYCTLDRFEVMGEFTKEITISSILFVRDLIWGGWPRWFGFSNSSPSENKFSSLLKRGHSPDERPPHRSPCLSAWPSQL